MLRLFHSDNDGSLSLPDGHARVITTSSSAVYFVPKEGIMWEALGADEASKEACRKMGTGALYAQSKLVGILRANSLLQIFMAI